MNIYDQLKQLWARVTGLEKSGAATDTKIAALEAAAVRIPKNYSITETDTGLKWINGKSIYRIVIPIPTDARSGGNVDIDIHNIDFPIYCVGSVSRVGDDGVLFYDPSDYYSSSNNTRYNIDITAQKLRFVWNFATGTALGGGYAIIYYTKPDPVPTETKATKKKTTK